MPYDIHVLWRFKLENNAKLNMLLDCKESCAELKTGEVVVRTPDQRQISHSGIELWQAGPNGMQ